jgi:hypothetical protein
MNRLFKSINEEFDKIQVMAEDMHAMMRRVYGNFQRKFQFVAIELPPLDMANYRLNLRLLAKETESFCRDPINVMTEKRFLIRKFYDSLVSEARKLFIQSGDECDRWMRAVTLPLENQLREHKTQLQQRLDSLTKINQNSGSIQERLENLKTEQRELFRQRELINRLLSRVKPGEPEAQAA